MKDLSGKIFTHWKVIEKAFYNEKAHATYWICECVCGKQKPVSGGSLSSGDSISCGECHITRGLERGPNKDLSNQKFGSLTVIGVHHKAKNNTYYWKCLCDCGATINVRSSRLIKTTKTCGSCYKTGKSKHRYNKSLLQTVTNRLSFILKRCIRNNDDQYHIYGGRGITVYTPWCGYKKENAEAFCSYLLSLYPNLETLFLQGYQIDRINNDGNYEPGNLKLSTPKENSRNKSNNFKVFYNGEECLLVSLLEELNQKNLNVPSYTCVLGRLYRGWSLDDAISIPRYGKRKEGDA